MAEYTLDNLERFINTDLGTSQWIAIEQARINQFADVTEDHQWIHVDEEMAAKSPLGGTIAHGFLTLSLLPKLLMDVQIAPAGIVQAFNYGADKLRFLTPVRAGARIRAHVRLLDVTRKPSGILLKTSVVVEIENHEKPALIAETLSLLVPAPN